MAKARLFFTQFGPDLPTSLVDDSFQRLQASHSYILRDYREPFTGVDASKLCRMNWEDVLKPGIAFFMQGSAGAESVSPGALIEASENDPGRGAVMIDQLLGTCLLLSSSGSTPAWESAIVSSRILPALMSLVRQALHLSPVKLQDMCLRCNREQQTLYRQAFYEAYLLITTMKLSEAASEGKVEQVLDIGFVFLLEEVMYVVREKDLSKSLLLPLV